MWPPALFTRSLSCVRLHCTVVQTMTKDQKDELASAEKTLAWLEVRGQRLLPLPLLPLLAVTYQCYRPPRRLWLRGCFAFCCCRTSSPAVAL